MSKTISITLTKQDLSFWNAKSNDWLAESGEFEVLQKTAEDDIKLTAQFYYQHIFE